MDVDPCIFACSAPTFRLDGYDVVTKVPFELRPVITVSARLSAGWKVEDGGWGMGRVCERDQGLGQCDKSVANARQSLRYHALSSGEARTCTFTPRWEGVYMTSERLHLILLYYSMTFSSSVYPSLDP